MQEATKALNIFVNLKTKDCQNDNNKVFFARNGSVDIKVDRL
jgi:hypothetical protein